MAATARNKKAKRRSVREVLQALGWTDDPQSAKGACNQLADVVHAAGCRLWIGHLPAANDAHSVAGMLRQAALGDPELHSPIVSRGNLGAFDHANLLDAELVVSDLIKGFAFLGKDPPASWGGLNRAAREKGGKARKHRPATQRLFNYAYRLLAESGSKDISVSRVLQKIKWMKQPDRDRLQVKEFAVDGNPIVITDASGTPERTRRSSLWRYLKEARDQFNRLQQ